jgi:peroxiredoxin
MAQLRQDYDKFVGKNTEVIAVGPEDASAFANWWHEHQMPFIGIPDPEHKVAALYKQEFNLIKGGRLPALVVIDKDGKIRFSHFSETTGDIPTNEAVLAVLVDINKEGAQAK